MLFSAPNGKAPSPSWSIDSGVGLSPRSGTGKQPESPQATDDDVISTFCSSEEKCFTCLPYTEDEADEILQDISRTLCFTLNTGRITKVRKKENTKRLLKSPSNVDSCLQPKTGNGKPRQTSSKRKMSRKTNSKPYALGVSPRTTVRERLDQIRERQKIQEKAKSGGHSSTMKRPHNLGGPLNQSHLQPHNISSAAMTTACDFPQQQAMPANYPSHMSTMSMQSPAYNATFSEYPSDSNSHDFQKPPNTFVPYSPNEPQNNFQPTVCSPDYYPNPNYCTTMTPTYCPELEYCQSPTLQTSPLPELQVYHQNAQYSQGAMYQEQTADVYTSTAFPSHPIGQFPEVGMCSSSSPGYQDQQQGIYGMDAVYGTTEDEEDLLLQLHTAAMTGRAQDLQNILLQLTNSGKISFSIDAEDTEIMTPLMKSTKNSHIEATNLLLNFHADPRKTALDGSTLLHIAAGIPSEMMMFLLKTLPENITTTLIDQTDYNGRTPLHVAVECGNAETMNLLLLRGASVQAQDQQNGWTPLHIAVKKGQIQLVRDLVLFVEAHLSTSGQADASPGEGLLKFINQAAFNENTALHFAAELESTDVPHDVTNIIVNFLLDKGADPSTKNHQNQIPLNYLPRNSLLADRLRPSRRPRQSAWDNSLSICRPYTGPLVPGNPSQE